MKRQDAFKAAITEQLVAQRQRAAKGARGHEIIKKKKKEGHKKTHLEHKCYYKFHVKNIVDHLIHDVLSEYK